LPIFCNLCNKDFNIDDLPTNTPIFCPDCGSAATIIDASEVLQRRKNNIDNSVTLESPKAKTGQVEPLRIKKTKPYTPPVTNQASITEKNEQVPSNTKETKPYGRTKYNRRIAFVLTSLGVIGIVGVGHLYTKTRKRYQKRDLLPDWWIFSMLSANNDRPLKYYCMGCIKEYYRWLDNEPCSRVRQYELA
jgi:hypothetical protein